MKIGILGLGSIGQRHLNNALAAGHEVLGHDPADGTFIKVIHGRLGDARLCAREEVLKESDAIIIASPTSCHLEDFSSCIRHQKPVLIEKPIGDNLQAATALVNDAERISLPVMVGYNLRFHPCAKRAHAILSSGELGNPLWANFTCAQFNDRPLYLRDGVILNWSHEIDLALCLLGPAHLLSSSVRLKDGFDDMADLHLLHENGTHNHVHLDYITNPELRGFSIICDGGIINADLVLRTITTTMPSLLRGGKCHQEILDGNYDDDYADEFNEFINFISAIGGIGRRTIRIYGCTARQALEVLKICTGVRQQAGLK